MDKKLLEAAEKAKGEAQDSVVIRKSASDTDGANITVKKSGGKEFSIAKYMRGGLTGNWEEADYEKKQFFTINKLQESAGGGSFLVPPEFSTEIIEMLQVKAVVRDLGARTYDLKGDTLRIRKQTAGITAGWLGTNGWIKEGVSGAFTSDGSYDKYAEGVGRKPVNAELDFGQLELILKDCACIVKVSNNLLEDASPAADTLVKADMVKGFASAEDDAYLEGVGGVMPMGLYFDPLVATTTLVAALTMDNLMDAIAAIEGRNGTYTGWVMHPSSKNLVRKLKDANGNYIYQGPDLTKAIPAMLLGLPVKTTTNISTTVTTAGNLTGGAFTWIALGDWTEFAIAQKAGTQVRIDASNVAGNAFEYNETWFRAVMRVDCGTRQPASFHRITAVR